MSVADEVLGRMDLLADVPTRCYDKTHIPGSSNVSKEARVD